MTPSDRIGQIWIKAFLTIPSFYLIISVTESKQYPGIVYYDAVVLDHFLNDRTGIVEQLFEDLDVPWPLESYDWKKFV